MYFGYEKEVAWTQICEVYYEHAGAIDSLNRERQDGLCVEWNLNFNLWVQHIITLIVSVIAVDAFNAWKLDTGRRDHTLGQFAERLTKQLLTNSWPGHDAPGGRVDGLVPGDVSDDSPDDDAALGSEDGEEGEMSESQEVAELLAVAGAQGEESQQSQEFQTEPPVECKHRLRKLTEHQYYVDAHISNPKLQCRECLQRDAARFYCMSCTPRAVTKTEQIFSLCLPNAHKNNEPKDCFCLHIQRQEHF